MGTGWQGVEWIDMALDMDMQRVVDLALDMDMQRVVDLALDMDMQRVIDLALDMDMQRVIDLVLDMDMQRVIDLALDMDMQPVVVNTVIDLLKNDSAVQAKYCATSRKIAGSILDGVFFNFVLPCIIV